MTLAKFRCASWSGSGDHIVVCFRSTLVVFIFLFNEFNDDKSDCSVLEYQHSIRKLVCSEIEVGEREFDFWHQKMSV